MRKFLIGCVLVAFGANAGEPPPVLDVKVASALAQELSGDRAQRNLQVISQSHRMRASRGYRAAAEHIAAQLRSDGLQDVEILQFPADGITMFGTQKSRPAWDVRSAELWELTRDGRAWARGERIAQWDSTPLSLAQDSESANVTADLVDVGAGTSETDYRDKDVRGQLVLVSSQPEAVQALAVDRFGAAGIVSYAQNQRTAWWGEDGSLLRWGHLDTFGATPTFAFMVRPAQARLWQARLRAGDTVRLQASVDAGRHLGSYDIVTALPRPARSLRFIWPPEIEGTTILLNGRPDIAARLMAAVHMDMVGGGPETKAVFRVTRSPASLPTFVNDVAEVVAAFVNDETLSHASGLPVRYPLLAAGGGKEPLLAQMDEFTPGSDHLVLTDGAFRIPSVYLNDWPDRYIHTDRDVPANIDATKLQRAGFIGAATAWYLANLRAGDTDALLGVIERQRLLRTARMLDRSRSLSTEEAAALQRFHWDHERGVVDSIARFVPLTSEQRDAALRQIATLARLYGDGGAAVAPAGAGAVVYVRNDQPKGPMTGFGYDYWVDRLGKVKAEALALPQYDGLRADGATYALEALNFVDGRRSVQEIRDALAAEFGPVPLQPVAEYLAALATIGVLRR